MLRLPSVVIRSCNRAVRPSGYDAARRPVLRPAFGMRTFAAQATELDEEDSAMKEINESKNSTRERNEKKKSKKLAEDLPVDFSDISRAKVAIRGGVIRTDCLRSHYLSELIGANIYLKPELRQFTGSFKERGARNAILQLLREQGSALKGVIAASAGNVSVADMES
jgi:threonine synthase